MAIVLRISITVLTHDIFCPLISVGLAGMKKTLSQNKNRQIFGLLVETSWMPARNCSIGWRHKAL